MFSFFHGHTNQSGRIFLIEQPSLFNRKKIYRYLKYTLKHFVTLFFIFQIKRNIHTYENGYKREDVKLLKDIVAEKFLKDCKIEPIQQNDFIATKQVTNCVDDCRHLDEREETGTFLDKLSHKTYYQKIESLKIKLNKLYPSWIKSRKVEWTQTDQIKGLDKLEMHKGRYFETIESSKFCPSKALKLYSDSYEISDTLEIEKSKRQKFDKQDFYSIKDCLEDHFILRSVLELYPEVLDTECLVVNFNNDINQLKKPSETEQMSIIEQLIKTLSSLKRGRHMILLNYVSLTRLQVGVLFLLAYYFEEIGFIRPYENTHGIFLSEFKGDCQLLEHLTAIKESINDELLSILSIKFITQEPIYSMLVAHNINIMRESSLEKLRLLNN